jgi:FkbM family methyltransferase
MLASVARRATKLARLLTFPAGRHGLRYGIGAAIEHRQALDGFDAATIVDVGANKGQFALLAAEVFPGATIYCFEPLEEPAARLRKMLGTGVRLFETAIGRSESRSVIHISRRADSSSLLPIAKQSEVFPGTGLRENRVVSVAPLTNYLSVESSKQPALLKIDVQGYELEVLKGCDSLLFVVSICLFGMLICRAVSWAGVSRRRHSLFSASKLPAFWRIQSSRRFKWETGTSGFSVREIRPLVDGLQSCIAPSGA